MVLFTKAQPRVQFVRYHAVDMMIKDLLLFVFDGNGSWVPIVGANNCTLNLVDFQLAPWGNFASNRSLAMHSLKLPFRG